MQLTQKQSLLTNSFLSGTKSFLIWCFTLTVCFLVVGFPLGVVIVAVGAILSVALQSILPFSGILLVAGSLIGIQVFGVILSAAVLTSKGVNPQEISWLSWLHGEPDTLNSPIYASCPLTCDILAPHTPMVV